MSNLKEKTCKPCEGGVEPLKKDEVDKLLKKIEGWSVNEDYTEISRTVGLKNYYRVIAFVNAIAWMAHRENHHPDMEVSYSSCVVRYSTHAIGGLSENDFICAAKVDEIFEARPY